MQIVVNKLKKNYAKNIYVEKNGDIYIFFRLHL